MISDQQPSNTQTNTNSHTPLSLVSSTELHRSLFSISSLSPSPPVLTRRVPSSREALRTFTPTAFLTRISQ